jgi:hypothetical protein
MRSKGKEVMNKDAMDTDKLMRWADNMMSSLHEGPQNHAQVLMCAQTYALLAIANELKRSNDERERLTTVNQ